MKFGWNWLSSFGEEDVSRKSLRTHARTHARRTQGHDISPAGLRPVELMLVLLLIANREDLDQTAPMETLFAH